MPGVRGNRGNPRPVPSAPPGNLLAVKHGAQSPRLVAREVPAVLAELTAEIPFLQGADRLIVEQVAVLVVQLRRLRARVETVHGGSFVDEAGQELPFVALYLKLQTRLEQLLRMLGVGPAVRASMASGLIAARREDAAQAASEGLRARYVVNGAAEPSAPADGRSEGTP